MPEYDDSIYNLYGDIDKFVYPPIENWLSAFNETEMVVTDSFHSTVFSIIFNKPFCLLNTVLWLNDAPPTKLFKNYELQLLMFVDRMTFKNQRQDKKINFKSIYYCHDFLNKQIEIRDFNYGQCSLFG